MYSNTDNSLSNFHTPLNKKKPVLEAHKLLCIEITRNKNQNYSLSNNQHIDSGLSEDLVRERFFEFSMNYLQL
jgi:hypothetical protein